MRARMTKSINNKISPVGGQDKRRTRALEFDFDPMPQDVFNKYDEMRTGLAKEVLFNINETIAENELERIIRRLQKPDIQLLNLLHDRGPTYKLAIEKELGKETDYCLTRMKARGLVVPKRIKANYFKYILTDLGFNAYNTLNSEQEQALV
jgi:hypothetical protein